MSSFLPNITLKTSPYNNADIWIVLMKPLSCGLNGQKAKAYWYDLTVTDSDPDFGIRNHNEDEGKGGRLKNQGIVFGKRNRFLYLK